MDLSLITTQGGDTEKILVIDAPEVSAEVIEDNILKFYNRISGNSVETVEDIPADVLAFIQLIPYEWMVAPLVLERMDMGWGRPSLKILFGLNRGDVQKIGERCGRYKPKTR